LIHLIVRIINIIICVVVDIIVVAIDFKLIFIMADFDFRYQLKDC